MSSLAMAAAGALAAGLLWVLAPLHDDDLAVTCLAATPRSGARPGTIALTCALRRTGRFESTRWHDLAVFVDDREVAIVETDWPPRTKSMYATFTITAPPPGAHRIRVVIDPAQAHIESDETNNAAEIVLTI